MGNAPQGKAFDQVKSILGRLDRNIDAARAKRLTPAVLPNATPVASSPLPGGIDPGQLIGESQTPSPSIPIIGVNPPNTPGGPTPPGRSPFGRATPMRITRPSGLTGS
jgi:hypothetical protein